MKNTQACSEFTAQMIENFTPALDAQKVTELTMELMTLARKSDRYNLLSCNVGLTDRQQRASDKADARAQEIGTMLGTRVRCNGDPRGYAYKIMLPNERYNTWGGHTEGWGIPSL